MSEHSFHDPVRHLQYLRQSLSQDNESIGFFISAGCPLSVEMPVDKWPLIPDVKKLTLHISEKLASDESFTKLLGVLKLAGKNCENIEEILSYLRLMHSVSQGGDVRGMNEKELENLEKQICKIIVDKINVTLPDKETPYHRLCNWIRSIDRKTAIEIFTTNYDLLLEQSLEDNEVPYFDGFVGSRRSFFDLRALEDNLIPSHWTRLWKIHGSISWYQEQNNNQNKVYRSSEIKSDASHLIYPSHLKYDESRKMPYLALIDQLNRFLRKKSSVLIFCGYSFNDGHLNDTIMNALKSNPTAMALGLMFGDYYDKNKKESYSEAYKLAKKQHNLNIWTNDHAIIGTNFGTWKKLKNNEDSDTYNDFIESFDLDIEGSEHKKKVLKMPLGDFNNFTQYLKKIIGTTKDISND